MLPILKRFTFSLLQLKESSPTLPTAPPTSPSALNLFQHRVLFALLARPQKTADGGGAGAERPLRRRRRREEGLRK